MRCSRFSLSKSKEKLHKIRTDVRLIDDFEFYKKAKGLFIEELDNLSKSAGTLHIESLEVFLWKIWSFSNGNARGLFIKEREAFSFTT